jgi:hypothetical protein
MNIKKIISCPICGFKGGPGEMFLHRSDSKDIPHLCAIIEGCKQMAEVLRSMPRPSDIMAKGIIWYEAELQSARARLVDAINKELE